MLLDKIFLIVISLVLSLLTSVNSLTLVDTFFSDKEIAAKIASALLFSLMIISTMFTAIYRVKTVNELRRIHFLSWGALLYVIGLANFIVVERTATSNSMLLLLGVIYLSVHQSLKKRKDVTCDASDVSA